LTWELRQAFYYPRSQGTPPAQKSGRNASPIPYQDLQK